MSDAGKGSSGVEGSVRKREKVAEPGIWKHVMANKN